MHHWVMKAITRRMMLGGTAVAAGGAAAVAVGQEHRGRRWLHSVGLLDGPDAPPPDVDATVEWRSLRSRFEPADVGWAIHVPDRPQATVVCLHGRGADHRFTFEQMHLHRFTTAASIPLAVVGVDGGPSSYWHPRRDGRNPSGVLFEELLPAVGGIVGDLPVFLLGWSMGGYGALLAGAARPDAVSAVVATAPAMWRTFTQAAPGAFDDSNDFRAHDVFARAHDLERTDLAVRVDCGKDDPFAPAARALSEAMPSATVRITDGFHTSATWRSFVPQQLEFLRGLL